MKNVSVSHPELEELSAFVDGRLKSPRRDRMVDHLTSCPECRDLFTDAVHLIHEEGRSALDEPERRLLAGRWHRGIVIASAVAATLALVMISPRILDRLQEGHGGSLEELAVGLTEPASNGRLSEALLRTWQGHDWPRPRSAEPTPFTRQETRSFQLGVRVMELEIALRSDQPELAQRLTYRLESLLGDEAAFDEVRILYASDLGIRGSLEAGVDPPSLTSVSGRAAELLVTDVAGGSEAPVDPLWFDLGAWARAAQLAAVSGRSSFFEQRVHQRYLASLEERQLPTSVATPIQRLVALIAEEPADRLPDIEEELHALVTSAGGGRPSEEAQ